MFKAIAANFKSNVKNYGLGVTLGALALPAITFAQDATDIDVADATAVLTDNKGKLVEVAIVVFGIAALVMILRKIRGMFR